MGSVEITMMTTNDEWIGSLERGLGIVEGQLGLASVCGATSIRVSVDVLKPIYDELMRLSVLKVEVTDMSRLEMRNEYLEAELLRLRSENERLKLCRQCGCDHASAYELGRADERRVQEGRDDRTMI